MQSGGVSFYLAGASWCPYTQQALTDIRNSDTSVLGTNVKSLLQILECDKADASHPACVAVHAYPAILACDSSNCLNILDGYLPDYPQRTANAVDLFDLGQLPTH
jgi:hypothetical protein